MKNLRSLILLAAGAALAAAALYDASVLTRALGLPVEGGEAIVALAMLSMAVAAFVAGGLGLRRHANVAR